MARIDQNLRARNATHPEAAALERELRGLIRGEVHFDAGTRAVYSTDASNYRHIPIGVVVPRTIDDVVATVAACRDHGVPILSRGGGTSLAGQCCNVAVVIDHSKHLREILELDRDRRMARVQAGTVLDDLRRLGEEGEPPLTFGPDPSTHDHCTIGGMIGNNACGNHAIMAEFYGPGPRMEHNVREMEVLTYDGLRLRVGPTSDEELNRIIEAGGRSGEIYLRLRALRDRYAAQIRARFPDIPRRVSGYNLDALLPENGFDVCRALVGTESTCVTILEATLEMIPAPRNRTLVLLGFEDLYSATAPVPMYREHRPIALEGWDQELVDDNHLLRIHGKEIEQLPDGNGWVMAEFGGETREEADDKAAALLTLAQKEPGFVEGKVVDDPNLEEAVWKVRESGLGATAFVPGKPDALPGWEDSAVPPDNVSDYLRDLRGLLDRYEYDGSMFGHFGQGCVHCSITFDLTTADGLAKYRRFVDDASDLVLSYGGSLSGEHGDGQSRGELLQKMYGDELVGAFREFKSIWDPGGAMNPGKVVDARPILADLKLGADYRPAEVSTHFSYPEDRGSFAHAAFRCQGIGKCRAMSGQTMCPSYMVTKDEMHTTRGRARILFEMMNGAEIELWKSREVLEALDLCLSCKGCKGDCPVNVDMATYKAEFLSHHYDGRLRPRVAYAMGLIYWWARLASHAPGLANWVSHAPVVSSAVKWLGGIAPERETPRFATRTLKSWFRERGGTRDGGGPTVVVWPDTFTNYFHPEAGRATVDVLERLGYRVILPEAPLCCGRPLYDFGMLDLAKHLLREVLEALRPHIGAGVPVIGVEPSCLAVFRDEMPNLFPDDPDATRLSQQSFLLSEFLVKQGRADHLPKLHRKALVHGHCHHRAVMGFADERQVLEGLGLDLDLPEAGCCGMAGSFGFEKGVKYEVAQGAGERVLLPRVREAPKDTLIVADGFSCRTQIEQNTERRAMHLAQVIALAMDRGVRGPAGDYPELVERPSGNERLSPGLRMNSSTVRAAAMAGMGAIALGLAIWLARRRRR